MRLPTKAPKIGYMTVRRAAHSKAAKEAGGDAEEAAPALILA